MNPKRSFLIAATALALTVTASACSSSGASTDADSTASTPAATQTSEPATPDSDASATAPDANTNDATAQSDTVEISKSRYETKELDVTVGDTVTFHNNDGYAHTVTSKDDAPTAFDSGKFGQDETFQVEFTEPGTYNYFCQIHPTMRATVIVG